MKAIDMDIANLESEISLLKKYKKDLNCMLAPETLKSAQKKESIYPGALRKEQDAMA